MAGVLKDRTVLITGGTTGLGFATAERFVAEGARVVVTGRNPDTLAAAKTAFADRVEVWPSDASDPEAIGRLFERVRDELGTLDVLFLNAGIGAWAPLEMQELDDFDSLFATNVRGTWLALQRAVPVLKHGSSVVVNASMVASKGLMGLGAYAASKAALRSMVRTVAGELAPQGIRVNALSAGFVRTAIHEKNVPSKELAEAWLEAQEQLVPLGRLGRPDEVAGAVLFLASDDASYVTGIDLPVDGGFAQV